MSKNKKNDFILFPRNNVGSSKYSDEKQFPQLRTGTHKGEPVLDCYSIGIPLFPMIHKINSLTWG